MATALTTLANVKDWLQLTGNASDGTLGRMIVSFSAAVANYINRDLGLQLYVSRHDGSGGNALMLPAFPVVSVSSVIVGTLSVPAVIVPGGPGYTFSATRIALTGYSFTRGIQNVQVVSTAGYAQIPPEVEQAVIEWIADRFAGRDRIGISSKSLSGENVSFAHVDIPGSVIGQLQQYRKMVPN